MRVSLFFCMLALPLCACGNADQDTRGEDPATESETRRSTAASGAKVDCRPGETSITLPEGFCAMVFARDLGAVRHIAVDKDGDVYVILRSPMEGNGLVATRDKDQDGVPETIARFGDIAGSGIAIHDGWLYAATDTDVYRWRLPEERLVPEGEPELVVGGFPEQGSHAAKTIALGNGHLFVNVGAPSNACQEQDRSRGSPGMDPCPLLEGHGGIWRFDADTTGQQYSTEQRYATGIRNAVAIAWNPIVDELYIVQHGRDQLHQLFPDMYTTVESAKLPAEEMFRVNEGDNFGWPYCYYDQMQAKKVLAPEYGGDGEKVGRCDQFEDPIATFPGHWAPNGLVFYTADQFPERYRGGAFVAFHGSWNRAPEPQAGYKVVFVPFEGAMPSGDYEAFADGFAGQDTLAAPGQAEYRPMGLAVGPNGALYIGDTAQGRVWKVVWVGEA